MYLNICILINEHHLNGKKMTLSTDHTQKLIRLHSITLFIAFVDELSLICNIFLLYQ